MDQSILVNRMGRDSIFFCQEHANFWGRVKNPLGLLRKRTQMIPLPFVTQPAIRTRLVHSYRVAALAYLLAEDVNNRIGAEAFCLSPNVVRRAALYHDVGHPPFGHAGERALDLKLLELGGFSAKQFGLCLLRDDSRIEHFFKNDGPRFFINIGILEYKILNNICNTNKTTSSPLNIYSDIIELSDDISNIFDDLTELFFFRKYLSSGNIYEITQAYSNLSDLFGKKIIDLLIPCTGIQQVRRLFEIGYCSSSLCIIDTFNKSGRSLVNIRVPKKNILEEIRNSISSVISSCETIIKYDQQGACRVSSMFDHQLDICITEGFRLLGTSNYQESARRACLHVVLSSGEDFL